MAIVLFRRLLLVLMATCLTGVLAGRAQVPASPMADTLAAAGQPPAPAQPAWRELTTDPVLRNARLRTFRKDNLENYVNDSDYRYDIAQPADRLSWWQRLKRWLLEVLSGTLFRKGSGGFWETFGWVAAGVLLVYAVLKFIGADPRQLFARRALAAGAEAEIETDIHGLDFDQLIAEAVQRQHYQRAVRLHYLKSLKRLADRQWIDWRPHKTNYEYVRELKPDELRPAFRQVTYLFEHVRYGDFPLTAESFAALQRQFGDFEARIG